MSEIYIYIRFKFENYGYRPGDVVKAQVIERDGRGIHVTMPSGRGHRQEITCWSDLSSFDELNAMEVIAHAVAGTAFF